MASVFLVASVKSCVVKLPPPPLILLLFSLLLALTLLFIVPSPEFLSSFFLQLSYALHLQQQYLAFLLSPCPIFILANLIVFTLLLKSFYPSSSRSLSDTEYALPEHLYTASHGDFFLASHHQLCPPEDYHVLSFPNYPEEYINNWKQLEEVKGNMLYVKGASQQQQIKPQKEEAHDKLSSKNSGGNLGKMGQEGAKGPSKGSDLEPSVVAIPSNAAAKPYIESQALEQSVMMKPSPWITQHKMAQVVVINMEAICASVVVQERPAYAAKEEDKGKDLVGVANAGKEGEEGKELAVISATQRKHNKRKAEHATTPAPDYYMARSHSQRASSASTSITKSIPRARSMKSNPSTHFQPISSSHPRTSTSLDGLSDDEANKRFSDFIANRFALMKRESLEFTS